MFSHMSATKDFFVSYTTANQDWAEWVAWTLEQNGYTCVLQKWDFVPGQDFMQQMRRALDTCTQMIAVVSDDYFKSPNAGAELNAALVNDPLGDRSALIPVRVEECKLGGIMRGRIYIDLVGRDRDQAKNDLLQGIEAARLGRRVLPGEVKFPRPPQYPGSEASAAKTTTTVAPAATNSSNVTVLYLGCETGAGLNLTGQAEQIGKMLSESPHGARFKLESVFDVTTDTIFEVLNKIQPTIVHFAGKQNGGNVLIPTPSGSVTTVSDMALAGLLKSLDSSVSLVVIDTCRSLRCARAVTEVVDFAIGVETDIYDDDAIRFYNAFYRALASGKTLQSAHGQAKAALSFKNVTESEIPQLCSRDGVDARKVQFAQ